MNPRPSPESPADHLRYEFAQLEKMRQQILADMEAMRAQEHNLRTYEARLRDSRPPFAAASAPPSDAALDIERDKIARLRALVEAERRALVDERLVLREERALLTQKAEELKQREAWVEGRERDLKAKAFAPPPKPRGSASPFAAARSFLSFGTKRAAG